jgi:hypothetical protein
MDRVGAHRLSRKLKSRRFQQCAEFLPLRNRGLGLLAVAMLPIPLAGRPPLPLAPPCNRHGPFFVAVTGKASRFNRISVRSSRKTGKASGSETVTYFGGRTAIASISNNAPGRASCGTPIVVLAGGAAVFTYLSRTSR